MRALFMILAIVTLAALPAAAQQKPAASSRSSSRAAEPKATAASPVNLNAATQAQLESLPGIGPKAAQRILEYRQKNGGFKKPEDLMNVKGIGEKSFLKLKPLITVSLKADAATQKH